MGPDHSYYKVGTEACAPNAIGTQLLLPGWLIPVGWCESFIQGSLDKEQWMGGNFYVDARLKAGNSVCKREGS